MNVYCLYFPNGKRYVGVESKAGQRIRGHRRMDSLKKPNAKDHQVVHLAIRKHGWGNVRWRYLATQCSNEDGWRLERFFIKTMILQDSRWGYNRSAGGEYSSLGVKHDPARKARRRETIRSGGKHGAEQMHTPEAVANRVVSRRAGKGWVVTDEWRTKQSLSHKGKPSPNNPTRFKKGHQKGIPKSSETRSRISATKQGHSVSEETRRRIGDANRRFAAERVYIPGPKGTVQWFKPEQFI